jgi:membrane-associated phospholipid phosphatase
MHFSPSMTSTPRSAHFSVPRSRRVSGFAMIAALGLALGFTNAERASAQNPAPEDNRTVVPRDTAHPKRHQTLFTYRDAILAAGFAGLTMAMFPLDENVARQIRQDSTFNGFTQKSAVGFETISSPGAYVIGGSLYLIGRVARRPNLTDFAWHGTEALLVANLTTGFLKGTLGRARPFVSNDSNPRDFRLGGGFRTSDRQSFPSGHTSTAFAAAAAVTSEIRRLHPKALPYVATVMYGGATLVGLSRMYHNKHWASDVALGAAVGTFSGLKVVRYSHAHPDNKVDRVILHAVIAPDGNGGGYLGFTLPAP